MLILFSLTIVIILSIIVCQDFKFRAVTWILFPLLTLVIVLENTIVYNLPLFPSFYLINFCFVAVQLCLITLYFSVKRGKFIRLWESHLGLGDILLFLILCLFFSPVNFLLFYTGSLILTGVIVLAMRRSYSTIEVIPLAGIQSGLLALLIVLSLFVTQIKFKSDPDLIIPLRDGRT